MRLSTTSVVFVKQLSHHYFSLKLEMVGRLCPNLRSIRMRNVSISPYQFRLLFSTPKQQLKEFMFFSVNHGVSNDAVWTGLALNERSLEILDICGYSPPIHIVAELVATNRSLKKVGLRLWNQPCTCSHTMEQGYPAPVACFVQEFLCLTPSGAESCEISDACLPVRFRNNISVSVCQYQYL